MHTRLPLSVALLLGTAPTLALAQQAPPSAAALPEGPSAGQPVRPSGAAGARPGSELDPGYCRWVRAEAASRAALMVAPELFARGGLVNSGEVLGGSPLGGNIPRLTVGLRYSASQLVQGLALHRRADAECQRYRAESALEDAARKGRDVGARPALDARATYLSRTLPVAEARVEVVRQDVRAGLATVEELNALQLKLDGLRSMARQTQVQHAALLAESPLPGGSTLPEMVQRLSRAEVEVERANARGRQAAAWDVTLMAGYDQLFRLEPDPSGLADQRTPLLAMLTFSYNLGGLWQGAAETRAQEGRVRFIAEDVMGVDRRTQELLSELWAARTAERARLREVDVLQRDLQAQLESLERLQTYEVRRYRDTLWFEMARLGAEQSYLRAHLEAIDGFLGEPSR